MNAPVRIAIAGFRHSHIFDLLARIQNNPTFELAATCEEHWEESLMPEKGMEPDWRDFDAMLRGVGCDVIALGDCYGRRGSQAIRALQAGCHVLADKPLCTSLEELEMIAALVRNNDLRVGIMFDLRDHGNLIGLREVIRSRRIGEVQTVSFSAQHPLLPGKRPGWYFQPGFHGGTINDIAVHAMDFLPWLTGLGIESVDFARSWNAKAKGMGHFRDCGQLALRLSNGAGVLGDLSYLAPDRCGYAGDPYWRITVHGTKGFAETSYNRNGITVADDGSEALEHLPASAPRPGGYLADFLADVRGAPREDGLQTAACLRASRLALECEALAVPD
jgi:predicted dehydrogenase